MVEVAFKSFENYFEFFKDVREIYKTKENTLKSIIIELESKYSDLLNDKPKKQDVFLIPEVPKFKKEIEDERESFRASRENPSEISEVDTTQQKELFDLNDSKIIRRNSRNAYKTKLKPSNFVLLTEKLENCVQDSTYIVSPSYPPTKIRRTSDMEQKKSTLEVLQEKNANVKIPKEKVLEAQKKKSALIKASTEEKQRKREERGRKVAAQREAAEKEKQLAAMKSVKEKEQKLKRIQKLKDEKYKEEYLKKKQLAAIKAAEIEEKERRKAEEAAKLVKLKKTQLAMSQVAAKEVPQYGIDDVLEGDSSEDEDNPKKQIPSWATKKNREYPLNVQGWLNKKETVYSWFFNKNLKYPKLEELFSVEVKSRPRTSSAFWNSRICFNESFPLI